MAVTLYQEDSLAANFLISAGELGGLKERRRVPPDWRLFTENGKKKGNIWFQTRKLVFCFFSVRTNWATRLQSKLSSRRETNQTKIFFFSKVSASTSPCCWIFNTTTQHHRWAETKNYPTLKVDFGKCRGQSSINHSPRVFNLPFATFLSNRLAKYCTVRFLCAIKPCDVWRCCVSNLSGKWFKVTPRQKEREREYRIIPEAERSGSLAGWRWREGGRARKRANKQTNKKKKWEWHLDKTATR